MPNPYRLAEHDEVDVILLCAEWCKWLDATAPDKVPTVIKRLRRRSRLVAAIDGHDGFSLALPPRWFDQVDIVLKGQGLFRDRDMYNHRVGPLFGPTLLDGQLQRRSEQWSAGQLEKLRLAPPCFLHAHPDVRAAVRLIKPDFTRVTATLRTIADRCMEAIGSAERALVRPAHDMFFIGTLTSRQRYDLVMLMRELAISGDHRVSYVPPLIYGTSIVEVTLPGLPHTDATRLVELEEASLRIAPPSSVAPDMDMPYTSTMPGVPVRSDPLERQAMIDQLEKAGAYGAHLNRIAFRRRILKHRAVVAPPGYGEFTFRHGEAMMSGRVLVCPDLSYVQTMFPFHDGENVVFCRPDFSDLPSVAHDLVSNEAEYRKIATGGRAAWREWTSNWPTILESGLVEHVRAELDGR
jgi:hypothetical protein